MIAPRDSPILGPKREFFLLMNLPKHRFAALPPMPTSSTDRERSVEKGDPPKSVCFAFPLKAPPTFGESTQTKTSKWTASLENSKTAPPQPPKEPPFFGGYQLQKAAVLVSKKRRQLTRGSGVWVDECAEGGHARNRRALAGQRREDACGFWDVQGAAHLTKAASWRVYVRGFTYDLTVGRL